MKIIFMGTPDFAVKFLERLYKDGHDIVGVFTKEDKPKNRGMKLSFSPIKQLAVSHGTPVFQPKTLKDGNVAETIKQLNCDLIVVVAYGKLLPKEILDIPPHGCINIHGSILPKYRGASPVQHAVLNGEKETGLTSMYITEEMDAGDIIFVSKTFIGDDETSGELFERLSTIGPQLLSETIDAISQGSATRIPQNHDDATYAPLLTRDMSPIDWNKTAYEIKCMVRGLDPWPAATMEINNSTMKVYSVEITGNTTLKPPGSLISCGNNGIEVACSDGSILVKEVQAPGSKRMSTADYLRGNTITTG